jgi:hypothetical protein
LQRIGDELPERDRRIGDLVHERRIRAVFEQRRTR